MKKTLILLLFTSFFVSTKAQINDSIDILKYDIHLDITNIQGQQIKGYCDILFKTTKEIRYINLMAKRSSD